MDALFNSVMENWLAALFGAVLVLLVYFSKDIYSVLTGRDFESTRISIVYFTRNDFEKNAKKSDALHSRIISRTIPLNSLYKNRLLFWRVVTTAAKVTLELPVLHYGKRTTRMLNPIREWIGEICAESEFKRAMGFPFVEAKFMIAQVYDRSEDRRSYVVRSYAILEEDLRNFSKYLDEPPKAGSSFELIKKIAEAYKERPEDFLPVQAVMA